MNQIEMMDNVVKLSYITKEIERNIIMSLKDAYDFNEVYEIEDKELIIKEVVQFIHFKNFYFPKVATIKCQNKETSVILEQCHFLNATILISGTMSVISPQFNNMEGNYLLYNLKFCQNKIVELILMNPNARNYIKNIYHIQNVEELKISDHVGNSIIVNNSSDTFKMKKISIKNATNYHFGKFLVDQIEIENSEVEGIENLNYEELQIKNSTIYPQFDNNTLNLNKGKVSVQESTLHGKNILLAGEAYTPSNEMLFVLDTKETKEALLEARIRLVNCLKKIEKENNKLVKTIFNPNNRSIEASAQFYTQNSRKKTIPLNAYLYFETQIAPTLRRNRRR